MRMGCEGASWVRMAFFLTALVWTVYLCLMQRQSQSTTSSIMDEKGGGYMSGKHLQGSKVAVVYAFGARSPMHVENFQFFLEQGLTNYTNVDYFFVFNGDEDYVSLIPSGHPRVKGIYIRDNSCYDFGGWIHVMRDMQPQKSTSYDFFVFLNSGVRGPFYPTYLTSLVPHWHFALTSLITEEVKLVGTTISCGGKRKVKQPHVQSMAWATDRVGMQIILDDKTAFVCFVEDNFDRAGLIIRHELGISKAILGAGYNINSLLRYTHGTDFRKRSSWNCIEKMDPLTQQAVHGDGIGVHFSELLFFKTNRNLLQNELANATESIMKKKQMHHHQQKQTENGDDSTVLHENGVTIPERDLSFLTPVSAAVCVDIVLTGFGASIENVNKTLMSIIKHNNIKAISIHIILVSSKNQEGDHDPVLAEYVQQYPDMITVVVDGIGSHRAVAVNEGIRQSIIRGKANFILVINGGAVVAANWLHHMVGTAMSNTRIGAVGPLSNTPSVQSVPFITDSTTAHNNSLENFSGTKWTVDGMANLVSHFSQRLYKHLPVLDGFCMLFKRQVFDRIGLFDEKFFGGEEVDFAFRMAEANFTLVVDDAVYIYRFHNNSRSVEHEHQHVLEDKWGEKRVYRSLHSTYPHKMYQPLWEAMLSVLNNPDHATLFVKGGDALKILYLLLPEATTTHGGGNHQVLSCIQDAIAMHRAGAVVRVAMNDTYWPQFRREFPELQKFNMLCPMVDGNSSFAGLFDVVIATADDTVRIVKGIHERFPRVLPASYVQDSQLEDKRSYETVAAIGGVMFAETQSLIDEFMTLHHVILHKVSPIIFPMPPNQEQATTAKLKPPPDLSRPIRVLALVRPSTEDGRTLQALALLHARYGERVDLHTFGCTSGQFETISRNLSRASIPASSHHDVTILNRTAMGTLMTGSDVFLDLSTFYDRTPAEAMTAGCAGVVTREGGHAEFAMDGVNAFLVSANEAEEVVTAIGRWVEDRDLLKAMQRNAAQTSTTFNEAIGATQRISLFQKMQRRWLANLALLTSW